MRNKTSKLLFGMMMLAVVSCDPFTEDSITPDNSVNFNETSFYTLPHSALIIDLRKVIEYSFTNGSVTISKYPSTGYLSRLDNTLMVYSPYGAFTEGKDEFEVTVSNGGTAIASSLISIYVRQKYELLPCAILAIEDSIHTAMNSDRSIKFMSNDHVCPMDKEHIVGSIYLQPKHGQAILAGDSIQYIPGTDFVSYDTMVYKISEVNTTQSANAMTSYGLIVLKKVPCALELPDHFVLDLTDQVADPTATSECGEGFKLGELTSLGQGCSENAQPTSRIVGQTQNSGTICLAIDGKFVFVPNQELPPQNDIAEVEVCIDGHCKVTSILVKRVKDDWTNLPRVEDQGFSDQQINTVFFSDEKTGYVGGTRLWKTTDGGLHWRVVSPANTKINQITDIHFPDSKNGFAAYSDELVSGLLKTTDGGETWKSVYTNKFQSVNAVFFTSPSVGFIGVRGIPTNSRIFRTFDGGVTWTQCVSSFSNGGVLDLQFTDNSNGFAYLIGPGNIMKTTNGNNFTVVKEGIKISAIAVNGTDLFFVYDGIISQSPDGINNSTKLNSSLDSYRAISFSPSGDLGIAVGVHTSNSQDNSAGVSISRNSGSSWSSAPIDEQIFRDVHLIGVAIPSDKVAYAVTHNGHIIKYNDR